MNIIKDPETPVNGETLAEWYKLNEKLSKMKERELFLRKQIAETYFPNPVEGSQNKFDINDGSGAVLHLTQPINRTVDNDAFEALRDEMMRDGSNLPQLPLQDIVQWKPSLNKAEYNRLSDDEKKIIDRALIVKPGTPQMKIAIPKR